MKDSFICLLITVMIIPIMGIAQKGSSGVYLTAEDYKNGKLTYGAKCDDSTQRVQIKLTHFSRQYYIEIARYNPKLSQFVRMKRTQVFGYKTCEGAHYRFVNNRNYEILNPGEDIVLYRYRKQVVNPKGQITCTVQYCFSTNTDAPIKNLTRSNLKNAFPTNYQFQQSLDSSIKNDQELYHYDNEQKMYKINTIFKKQ